MIRAASKLWRRKDRSFGGGWLCADGIRSSWASSPLAAVESERRHFSFLYLSNQFPGSSRTAMSFLLADEVVNAKVPFIGKSCCFSNQALTDIPAGVVVDIPLAQTGEGIAECELLKWFVQDGDQVEEFQPLCEVQSDKATIEITSRHNGKIFQLLYVPGDIVKVGETLLRMSIKESEVPREICGGLENNEAADTQPYRDITNGGVLSTPSVRDLAKQYGIEINEVHGTGKDGRVLKEDVMRYAMQKGICQDQTHYSGASLGQQALGGGKKFSHAPGETNRACDDKAIPLRGFQRTMVRSMINAAKVPHFHYVEEINCDALVELKQSLQSNNTEPGVKYTFLPLLIKSLSMAMSRHPIMNSFFNEEAVEVILKGSHNVGIAMATPHGLVVPNIKNVQSLSTLEITKELSRLQRLALDNKLTPEDIAGGTITLSNIGAIGGKFGSPLLNLPEVSIIAIGRIQKVPQFSDDGNIYPVSILTVNVGADHRVLDGATVARFCTEWKRFIENPELLVLHMR